eukprot:768782-Hanusia_phi.AAC.4
MILADRVSGPDHKILRELLLYYDNTGPLGSGGGARRPSLAPAGLRLSDWLRSLRASEPGPAAGGAVRLAGLARVVSGPPPAESETSATAARQLQRVGVVTPPSRWKTSLRRALPGMRNRHIKGVGVEFRRSTRVDAGVGVVDRIMSKS